MDKNMDKYVRANMVFSKFCTLYTEQKKDIPVRPSELGVLNIIVLREGKFTPVMLADMLDVSKPMVSAHVTALEKKGYITKEHLERDHRSFYVVPTEKAIELVKGSAAFIHGNLRRVEAMLGEETFAKVVDALYDANGVLKMIHAERK